MDLTFLQNIEENIIKKELIHPRDKIIAMISGGRDSVVLLYFLDYMRKKYNIETAVFHLNHMIRGWEADRDEAFSRNLAERLGFPFYYRRVDVVKIARERRENLESIAREERYRIAEKIRKDLGYELIATAHTKTDFAETVIMHLLRGDSIYGVLGIAYKYDRVIRPLLSVSREEITVFLKKNNLQWVDDSTNTETSYTRNYIRNVLGKHFRKIGGDDYETKIMNLATALRDYVETSERCVAREIENIVKIKKNKLHLDLMGYFHYNGGERRLLIAKILKLMGIDYSRNLISIVENFLSAESERFNYNNIFNILKSENEAVIWKNVVYSYKLNINDVLKTDRFIIEVKKCENCSFEKSKEAFYFPLESISFPIVIRNAEKGDRMIPFGFKSAKKVKDIYNGEGIKIWDRDDFPLVVSGAEIVGILGVKRSALYPVNSGSNVVVEFRRVNGNSKIY